MRDLDAAWVAGILEGEGSFVVQLRKKAGHLDSFVASVRVSMTDKDIVDRVAALVGRPELVRPEPARSPTRKPMWRLQLTKQDEVYSLLTDIRPWMGTRRTERIDQLLAHLETRRLARLEPPASSNRSKTSCPAGHPYDEANTLVYANGHRRCRACDKERHRARRASAA